MYVHANTRHSIYIELPTGRSFFQGTGQGETEWRCFNLMGVALRPTCTVLFSIACVIANGKGKQSSTSNADRQKYSQTDKKQKKIGLLEREREQTTILTD